MKKEDLQNSQQGTGSAENRGINRDEQKNQTTNISGSQQKDISRQAGLGRDRMTDIEGLGGMSGREDLAGGDEDLTNENLNAANDQ
ncbi:MAG: hypothetical protein J7502_15745 [Flavisolibacter sp.]|nr:hypothetical protein [Flavisolibacter sp.]